MYVLHPHKYIIDWGCEGVENAVFANPILIHFKEEFHPITRSSEMGREEKNMTKIRQSASV